MPNNADDEREFIVMEAENFAGGWCVVPVLLEKESRYKAAFAQNFRSYPEMAGFSGGRYLYSGTKLTGLHPAAEVDIPRTGRHVLWVRGKKHTEPGRGTFRVRIGDWTSRDFGGCTEGTEATWTWERDTLTVRKAGRHVVELVDTQPEACCDVLVLTTDPAITLHGADAGQVTGSVIRVPHHIPACIRERQQASVELREFHHARPISYSGYFGDLDGDGLEDIVLPLETGCFEAYKADGTMLWRCEASFLWHKVTPENYRAKGFRYFIPHDFRPVNDCGNHPMRTGRVVDIDGDGRPEFVYGWNPIYVIDAATGRIKHERRLPGQASRMDIADLTGDGKKTELFVATKDAVEGRAYLHALDAELNTIWSARVRGPDIEHTIAVGDLDGDGRDEVAFTAYNNLYCIDDDGSVMWVREGRDTWGGIDFHSDAILIEHIDEPEDGTGVLLLAEGRIFNADGTVRWEGDHRLSFGQADYDDEVLGVRVVRPAAVRCFDHGQMVTAAKLRDDVPGKQILFGERNIGNVYCYAADGQLLWKRGRYYGGERVHVSDILPINWTGQGRKEVLCRYLGIFDAFGNLVALPPFLDCGASNLSVAGMTRRDRDDIVVTMGSRTLMMSRKETTATHKGAQYAADG